MIYFDNGATSFPKPRGMSAEMEDCILNYCGNPGRSGHYMSMKTGEKEYDGSIKRRPDRFFKRGGSRSNDFYGTQFCAAAS